MNAHEDPWKKRCEQAADQLTIDRLAADPDALQAACEDRLASAWGDEVSSYPCPVETAAALMRARGYDVTAACLSGWAAAPGMIGGIEYADGKVGWNATSIIEAMAHAEQQRRWLPLHPLHAGKMSDVELADQQAGLLGGTIFKELDSVDCRSMLAILVQAQKHEDRIVLGAAFAAKLRFLGVLDR